LLQLKSRAPRREAGGKRLKETPGWRETGNICMWHIANLLLCILGTCKRVTTWQAACFLEYSCIEITCNFCIQVKHLKTMQNCSIPWIPLINVLWKLRGT
jgi:hypothetical protein